MAQPACGNLNRDIRGRLLDPITLEVIPPKWLITITVNNFTYCYDARSLLIYFANQKEEHYLRREEGDEDDDHYWVNDLRLPERVSVNDDAIMEVMNKVLSNYPKNYVVQITKERTIARLLFPTRELAVKIARYNSTPDGDLSYYVGPEPVINDNPELLEAYRVLDSSY